MRLWLLLRRRWRMVVWLLLTSVFIFDAVLFIGIPRFKAKDIIFFTEPSWSSNYLQITRRHHKMNKSTSSNLNGDLGGRDVAFHMDIVNVNISGRMLHSGRRNHITSLQKQHDNIDEEGDGRVKEVHTKSEFRNPADVTSSIYSQPKDITDGHINGARANYSLPDVDKFVKQFQVKYNSSHFSVDNKEAYTELLKRFKALRKKGSRLPQYINNKGQLPWESFHYGIHQHFLYDPDELGRLLQDVHTKEIISVEQKVGGTQIKLIVTFEDDGQALLKPMRYSREQETLPDHFYFADFERHNAEIAAFHLDIVLGFHRVPPTIGRLLNVSSDIQNVCDFKLAKTFFESPAGNLCFHGSCSYYCDSSHPICGHPEMLEGSLAVFLPPTYLAQRKTWRNPWKRSYSKHRKAYWEVYDDLCANLKQKSPYNEGRRLLDILDMSVFDFLTGNLDRHHYETFKDFGNDTFLLHLDNGRAFGKSKYDCMSCLAPVRQCCMIRLSTLTKLIKLYIGPSSLSQMLRSSLRTDPLNPVLVEAHLDALDRRVSKIVHVLYECTLRGKPWDDVIIDDGVR